MYKKKLIETAIPLDDINSQAVREKSIRKGHPSTLHLWWARRPLAAARCVIFASMVDDPAEHPELFPDEAAQDKERDRLFDIMRGLANWDNIDNKGLYDEARAEMLKYAPDGVLPEFLDPFAGGGALPLEAQRLGLVSHAADLNPIPVTLNRAMIDIPARFCGHGPVNPEVQDGMTETWDRATGLAEDVDHYAKLMCEMAKERVGGHYPDVDVTYKGHIAKATPIAYIWARTVTCPNPACQCEAPLVRSFWLSTKKDARAYVEPVAEDGAMHYVVHSERDGWTDFNRVEERTAGGKGARCLHCGAPISLDYIRDESSEHGLGSQLMAIASESPFGQGRWYSSATKDDSMIAACPRPITGFESAKLAVYPGHLNTVAYGIDKFVDLFTNRQLLSLVTLSDLVVELRPIIEHDAREAGMAEDNIGLDEGGAGAKAYADAVSVYLACMVDKQADYCSSICTWHTSGEKMSHVFTRQAIPMTWDYAEVNPLSGMSGSFKSMAGQIVGCIRDLPARPCCDVTQRDAAKTAGLHGLLVSTDPPYYDNIDYSDLSDYFYMWMRRGLKDVYPSTFATMLTPKAEELVAMPFRFEGGGSQAKCFFEDGMRETFKRLAEAASDDYPMTVYYAYKQSNMGKDGRTSSGWETMLQALMDAGLQITGTWPMRTEMPNRSIASGSNALASSIVLVCRKQEAGAPVATRPEFMRELRSTLKEEFGRLQGGLVAPVDMAQAAIGPGMSAFSKFSQVLESDGTPMSVHTALGIINDQLDQITGESSDGMDRETRFCISWYEQYGFDQGPFGDAETLRNARGASLDGLVRAGVLESASGKVRLCRPVEVSATGQARIVPSCWADLMALAGALGTSGVEGTAAIAADLDDVRADHARALAYLLFQAADQHGRTEDASLFNDLVTSWADVAERAEATRQSKPVQQSLDLHE